MALRCVTPAADARQRMHRTRAPAAWPDTLLPVVVAERDPQCATCAAGVPPLDKCTKCKLSTYKVYAATGQCGPVDCRIQDAR